MSDDAVTLTLRLGGAAQEALEAAERELRQSDRSPAALSGLRARWRAACDTMSEGPELHAVLCVLADLVAQGWDVELRSGDRFVLIPPDPEAQDDAERTRIRAQEQVKRVEQLHAPSVQKFLSGIERRRLHAGAFVSIFDLMRDGRELERELRGPSPQTAIQPYVQPVTAGERCAHTGLQLTDIWRYFRHTWSNQYTSVPGRSMAFLVRDAAAQYHPVVGIFALSSAIVQIGIRETHLGWHPDSVLERLEGERETELVTALREVVRRGTAELYTDDLIREDILTGRELRQPTDRTIAALAEEANHARESHELAPDPLLKKSAAGAADEFWRRRAETSLYRMKRCQQLGILLEAHLVLSRHLSEAPTEAEIQSLLNDREGERTVRRLVRRAKAERVGISLADLSVCGALPPYSHLIGGKLIAMLAASPDVVRAYEARYGGASSEIASAMAGRAIVRPPELVFIGTTSLYGVALNQYTRVSYPCEPLGGTGKVRYRKLGYSEAYGTSQFARETVTALDLAARRKRKGKQRVNHIFGEGTSPKMRMIREGLEAVGLPSDALLRHGRRRVVYGVELTRDTSEYLLGLQDEPRYRFDLALADNATATIAAHWWDRWVASRLEKPGLLERVGSETLQRPIQHGARVALPAADDDGALKIEP